MMAAPIVSFPAACGSTQRPAPTASRAAEVLREKNLMRDREKLLAFVKVRIAEDQRDHRTVSVHKIVSEYRAKGLDRQGREAANSTITVGNPP
jgi:hypothetical protein